MPPNPSHEASNDRTSLSLLERAKSDDQDAWQRIVQLYGPLVFSWLRRGGLSQDDMPDVFQDVFRAVAQGIGRFTHQQRTGSFRAWLRTVARSKIANHFNAAGRRPAAAGGTDANLRFSEVPDPLAEETEDEIESDNALLVRQALELIRPDFNAHTWEAFRAVAIDGKEVREMAAKLEMTEQAVRQGIYRIRRRLRKELEGLLDWPDPE